jgi:RHS repeat-associated protein
MYRKVCCLFIFLFIYSAFPSLIHADNQTVFGPKSFEIGTWHIHASVHKFNVEDPGEGVVTVTKNTPDKPISGGFILFNTTFVPLRNFLTGDEVVFEKEIILRSINFITVFLLGTPEASVTITINSGGTPSQPPEVSFSTNPQTITLGESSTLAWNVIDADNISIDPGIGSVDPNGSYEVLPTETTTYTLTAVGAGGTTTESVTVSVNIPLPTVSISADPEAILLGESSTLTWSSTHADTCVIEPGVGSVDVNGSISVSPTERTTYTITVTGPGGTASAEVIITVTDPNATPTVTISPESVVISQGESITLTWNSGSAQSAFIDNGVGSVPVNGSTTVYPEHTTIYTITVTGATGSNSAQAKIQVTGNPAPLPEGSFGEQYEDLIPTDATVDEYDTKRFSLITGLVRSIDDSPISDVSVTLHGHPEYGTVSTDVQGRFSLPIEGGTTLTVVYQKDGFITAHRKVYVPWNDIAIAETIRMIAEDPVASTITFNGNPDTVVTHRSTQVSDEFGSRSATMVFTGDNHAYLLDENGNDVLELTTITTRATEYTTPESMPAKLPPNSAYTYCAELSVDGAQRVRFEKPVIIWVDNFLGFDVGEIVPVGYYDRDRGVWIPSDNGVVVKLLDTDSDGIVDALDADGDDTADDLDGDGSYIDEVEGLENPSAYSPGGTYWRISVTHFTPWDCNWPYGPPFDVTYPNPIGEPDADQQKTDPCEQTGKCTIEQRSRIFHEDIHIPGTDITLHYASNRVEEYQTKITVPASGDTVPDSLKKIVVTLNVAGRNFKQTLDPLPNQNAEFIWDGLDRIGRQINGPTTAYVRVGFVYNLVYYSSNADFKKSFAQVGTYTTLIWGREEMVTWKPTFLLIPQESKGKGLVADGWTISSHHYLNPLDLSTLHKGDGTITKNIDSSYKYNHMDIVSLVETVAGNGTAGYSGDDGQAVDAQLYNPTGITVDAAGNFYVADRNNHSIRKVDVNGIITTVAGNGTPGYSGDRGPATQAQLHSPSEVAVDVAGNLYIVDADNYCIRKVDVNGIITTVAGNGTSDYSGDGGPASEASLVGPEDIALDAYGNLYILDYNGEMLFGGIRKVAADGIIETISPLPFPASSIALDASANIYVSDTTSHIIWKGDISGAITPVAGNGTPGYIGDGGPATEAQLNYPTGITVDPMGNIYFVDGGNECIRKVNPSGIITTVAGQGAYGYSSDGVPVDEVEFSQPSDVSVDDSGKLYAAYTSNHFVAKIGPLIPYVFLKSIDGKVFAEESGWGHVMSMGLHLKTVDLDTGAMFYEFTYDEDNNLISVTDRFGNQITIERDENDVPISITSPDGLTTALTIDANNHLTGITYPDGSHYSFEYTPDGLMTAKVEPEGNRFEHAFDYGGKLTSASDEEGAIWQYSRSVASSGYITTEVITGEGNLTSYLDHTDSTDNYTSTITDATGAQTVYSQSKLTVNKSLPCGMDLEFQYDIDPEYKFKYVKEMTETAPAGLVKSIARERTYQDTDTDAIPDLITETVTVNDKTTTFTNNIPHSRKTVTSPEGRTITMLYDPSTLLTESMSITGLFDTTYGYDTRGRMTSVDTNTRGTDLTYSAQGFLESVTDPENHTTTYSYDAVGRVTGINRPDTTSIGFAYDNNGNMTVLTNPSTINHGFGYNKVNLNSSYQTPLSGSYSYVYDKDRRLKQTNFPSGNQINNIYANGRLEQIQTPEGNIDFTYLCGTKVGSISKGSESITYGYDGKLVTSETLNGTLNQTLGYTYNDDFNVTTFTYAGNAESFAYDNDGLLTGAGSFTISRNAGNGLPEEVTGGSLSLSRTFNGYGEVSDEVYSVSGQGITSWNLARDNNGRITNKSETVAGTTSDYTYTYDSMGRLLTVTKDSNLVEEYQYDANGTRIYEMNSLRSIAGRSYSYDDEDHLLTAGSVIYSYNLDGFLAAKTDGSDVTTYDYSSRGELFSVTLPDGRIIEYVHDPRGRRIVKKINGVIVEKYLWQGLTRLLAVYDGSDNLLMRFEYADDRMPVAMTKGGSTYYLTYDQVGSLRVVADASGNVVKRIHYDSFGNIIEDTDPSFEVPFGFAGVLHDRDTGLVRFGFRDFDPDIGRWTAKDPILFFGGDTDLYGYCLNNPINLIDPQGLFVPSEQFFSNTETAAMVFGTASFFTGNVPVAGVFMVIGSTATALKSYFYSDSPCNDAIKEGVKALIPAPKGFDPIKDEIVDTTLDWYIDQHNLPKM